MLLKSCAMPPASCPTACIFSAWLQLRLEALALFLGAHLLGDVLHEADHAPRRRRAVRIRRCDSRSRPASCTRRRRGGSGTRSRRGRSRPTASLRRSPFSRMRSSGCTRSIHWRTLDRCSRAVPSTASGVAVPEHAAVDGIELVEQVAARADHRLVAAAPRLGLAPGLLALDQQRGGEERGHHDRGEVALQVQQRRAGPRRSSIENGPKPWPVCQ